MCLRSGTPIYVSISQYFLVIRTFGIETKIQFSLVGQQRTERPLKN